MTQATLVRQTHLARPHVEAQRRAQTRDRGRARSGTSPVPARAALLSTVFAVSPAAHASLFSGDTLDLVANILAWIVLFVAPAVAIGVFWIVHILPERIAEKRHHPQTAAIKTLCFLSLFFGGLLWPLAWLWAYSKPVLHKIAYGTDSEAPADAASMDAAAEARAEDTVADDVAARQTPDTVPTEIGAPLRRARVREPVQPAH